MLTNLHQQIVAMHSHMYVFYIAIKVFESQLHVRLVWKSGRGTLELHRKFATTSHISLQP